jgi:hypothetical protein
MDALNDFTLSPPFHPIGISGRQALSDDKLEKLGTTPLLYMQLPQLFFFRILLAGELKVWCI